MTRTRHRPVDGRGSKIEMCRQSLGARINGVANQSSFLRKQESTSIGRAERDWVTPIQPGRDCRRAEGARGLSTPFITFPISKN